MLQVGERLPGGQLWELVEGKVQAVDVGELAAGRTLVLFGVPGAFTPTCTAKHLPGFAEQAAAMRAKGVDEIACLSVNDAFVMLAWGLSVGTGDAVRLLGDGNADFVTAAGLDQDSRARGMGTRSQRFALIAKDGVVSHIAIDPAGTFEATSAEAILKALD